MHYNVTNVLLGSYPVFNNIDRYIKDSSPDLNLQSADNVFKKYSIIPDSELLKIAELLLCERLKGFREEYLFKSYLQQIFITIKGIHISKSYANIDDTRILSKKLLELHKDVQTIQDKFNINNENLMDFSTKID